MGGHFVTAEYVRVTTKTSDEEKDISGDGGNNSTCALMPRVQDVTIMCTLNQLKLVAISTMPWNCSFMS